MFNRCSKLVPLLAAATLVLATGCTITSGDDAAPEASAETKALFTSLPAPTPDTLRGVWSLTSPGDDGTAEIRVRFTEDRVVGGVSCSKDGVTFLVVGGSVSITTTDLGAKRGVIRMPQKLAMSGSTKQGQTCSGGLEGADWSFAVNGTTIDMSSGTPLLHATLQKVGD